MFNLNASVPRRLDRHGLIGIFTYDSSGSHGRPQTHFVGVLDFDASHSALEYGATSPSPIREAGPGGSVIEVVEAERTKTMVAVLSQAVHRSGLRALALLLCLLAAFCRLPGQAEAGPESGPRVVDLSLLIAPEYPCIWPTFPPFQINHYQRIGPLSAYHSDILVIDGNTGTQLDVPPHSVTPPESSLPNAGPFGRTYTDAVPAWQFGGEACVIDCRDLRDSAPAGQSPLIKKERVIAWEKAHRPLGPGDVVLFHSGYSDAYYKPFPGGAPVCRRPARGQIARLARSRSRLHGVPGGRKVMTLGTDSTSMGPLPDLAEPTHYAGLKHGMIWTESNIGLGALPADRRVLLHPQPQVCGRHLQRMPGVRRHRRPARPPADRLGPQEERRRSVGRPVRRPARHLARPGRGQPSPALRQDPLRPQSQHANAL